MPNITVGPNSGGFSETARLIAQQRQADVQQVLQRQQMQVDVIRAQQESANRQAALQQSADQFQQQMAQKQYDDMVNQHFRQLEADRLQAGQEHDWSSNDLVKAIQTGVKMGPDGTYRALKPDDTEYQPWQDNVAKQKAALEETKAQHAQQRQQFYTTERPKYLLQGVDLDPETFQPVPLEEGSPAAQMRDQLQAEQEARRPKSAEELISIDEARQNAADARKAPERQAAADKAAFDKYDKLDADARAEEKILRGMESDRRKLLGTQTVLTVQDAQAEVAKATDETAKADAEQNLQRAQLRETELKRLDDQIVEQRQHVDGMRRRRDEAGRAVKGMAAGSALPSGGAPSADTGLSPVEAQVSRDLSGYLDSFQKQYGRKPNPDEAQQILGYFQQRLQLPRGIAAEYLRSAKGNPDLARQMAARDGWRF